MHTDTKQLTAAEIVGLSDGAGNAIGSFVHRYGRFYEPQKLPRKYKRGRVKECFGNCFYLQLEHPGLVYVEGFAVSSTTRKSAPLHAWCVDSKSRVVDPTWAEIGHAYFGVPFRADYLLEVIKKRDAKYFGLIDDWQQNYPLLNELADEPALWLAETEALSKIRF